MYVICKCIGWQMLWWWGNAMRVRWLFSCWCLNNLFLNSLLHRILFLPSNLFPSNDAGLDQKKNAGNIVEDSTNKSQAKGPGKVIVFPVRHEVATVPEGTENDKRNCTKCTWKKKKIIYYVSIWVALFCMHQALLTNISKTIQGPIKGPWTIALTYSLDRLSNFLF